MEKTKIKIVANLLEGEGVFLIIPSFSINISIKKYYIQVETNLYMIFHRHLQVKMYLCAILSNSSERIKLL